MTVGEQMIVAVWLDLATEVHDPSTVRLNHVNAAVASCAMDGSPVYCVDTRFYNDRGLRTHSSNQYQV